MKFILTCFCLVVTSSFLAAQNCTTPGQNPSTAFPVCGTSSFTQSSVPLCGGRKVPSPVCTVTLTDINPFWYKFTCFQSGTLGFKITPNTNSEDYDWQLFDVTNRNTDDVYTDVNLVVGSNWSGEGGETGASGAGTQLLVCDGYGKPLWSKMPDLVKGHQYLLLVSHFTQTQSGYSLSFGGGTAVITDPTQPALKYADASCGGDIVRIKLNKKMKCSSIVADGSDFYVSPGNIPAAGAKGIGCSTGFDTDSIELQLSSFLAPGSYTLHVRQGGDGNTVLDYCDKAIPTSDAADFTVYPLAPTPMDSLSPLQCAPQVLRLVFRKPMLCSTVAPDGSDFILSGPYPVSITSAYGACSGSATTSKEIVINVSQPLYQGGNFTLGLKTGSDGNTVLDECGKETPAGSSLLFDLKDTVNAGFGYQKFYGCANDTIQFSHPGGNGIDNWQWDLDDNQTSSFQNPLAIYSLFNSKNISLIVSNGFCSDTSAKTVVLDNFLKADFSVFEDNCPNEPVDFTSSAEGHIVQYEWLFGDGGSSGLESTTHIYAGPVTTTPYTIQYTVTDSLGCETTAQKKIKIYSSCYLAVPTAFTPNHDGRNDFLYPLNAIKAEKLDFKVYNRWGQLVFETRNWKYGWDGSFKGLPQAAGVYVWFLSYVDRDTKESRQMKGTAALIR
jgi:gliding motility-associated-like protein